MKNSKNALNSVQIKTPSTNAFNLSHQVRMSGNMGFLYPCLVLPCLPGDRVRIGCENLSRFLPMLAPIMENVDLRVEYFFSADRTVWENHEIWITNGGDNPLNAPPDPLPARPFIEYFNGGAHPWADFPLMDYMGLPDPQGGSAPATPEKIQCLPFAHYQKICDDYYRDENLVDKVFASGSLLDGDNVAIAALELLPLRKRAWEADYFNKSLPFAQKGEPVNMPLDAVVQLTPTLGAAGIVRNAAGHATISGALTSDLAGVFESNATDSVYDPNGTLIIDGATSTVNDFRLAVKLQEWLELNARGGTRYAELIRAHFNVFPQDSRLQRPEYIVGVKTPIKISEVLSTAEGATDPVGTMVGHGVSYDAGNYGKYFATEHGYIIGIVSVMPKPSYQQGIAKDWLKYTDPTELGWPKLANLGEQPIQNREIMAFQAGEGDQTFGYTPRYMEYKTMPNRVAGQFRSTLDHWTLTQIFDPSTPPELNEDFVYSTPTTRIFAVEDPDEDHILMNLKHNIMCIRALPFYGTPSFL